MCDLPQKWPQFLSYTLDCFRVQFNQFQPKGKVCTRDTLHHLRSELLSNLVYGQVRWPSLRVSI
jgi:hypothetical protein